MDDLGQVWDQLLVSAPQRESTTTWPRKFTSQLRLREVPTIEILPEKCRLLSQIPANIRAVIRSCLTNETPWPLVLIGSSGTGKTCAALCLLDFSGGRYWAAADLCDDLRRADAGRLIWSNLGHGGEHYPEHVWEWITKTPLMVLDELGCRDKVSDFQYETAKRVLDKRENKPLIVISNLTLKVLAELYDDRFASRLAAGTVLEVAGEDRRLTK